MNEQFPQRLKRMRLRRGMTQDSLAEQCNLHANAIANYETGRRTPSTEGLCKLADRLEVSIDYLLCRTDDPRRTS